MARWGMAATTALLAGLALGVSGCDAGGVSAGGSAAESAQEAAVDVEAAMGDDGLALAALGFDAADLDVDSLAAPTAPGAGSSPAPSAGDQADRGDQRRKRRMARVLLRRNTLHGEAVVKTKDGATKHVVVQRGEITAITDTSVTVKSSDGFTMTWTIADNLRVIERRSTVQPSALAVGTQIGIAGAKDGERGIWVARLILVPRRK